MTRAAVAVFLLALASPLLAGCGSGHAAPAATPAATRSPNTLRLSFPVGSIAAEGTEVAAVPTGNWPDRGPQRPFHGVMWDVSTRRVESLKLPRTCAGPWGTSLAGSRMAVVCDESCCASIEQQVVVSQPGRDPVTVMRVTGPPGAEIAAVAGGGRLLLFTRDTLDRWAHAKTRTLYQISGGRAHILEPEVKTWQPRQPWFISHDLILVDHGPFGVAQPSLTYDGRLVYEVNYGAAGALAGVRPSGVEASTAVCSISPGATLGGASGGYVTYTTEKTVHVIRMSNCRDALITRGHGISVDSAITPAGLFYALGARRIHVMDTDATIARIRSTLTFVPMARVERLVSRGPKLGGR